MYQYKHIRKIANETQNIENTNKKNTKTFSSHRFPYGYHVTTSLASLTTAYKIAIRALHKDIKHYSITMHNRHYTLFAQEIANFTSVTGGVYKTRLHLHRSVLIYDYSQFRLHVFEFQKTIRTKDNCYSLAHAHAIASVCRYHCSTCIAQSIKAIKT